MASPLPNELPNCQRRQGRTMGDANLRIVAAKRVTGFSLLELMAATAIAAVFVIQVTELMSSLRARHDRLAHQCSRHIGQSATAELLRQELHAASSLEIIPQGVRLTGPLATDPHTGRSTGRRAEVRYTIASPSPPWQMTDASMRSPDPARTVQGDGLILWRTELTRATAPRKEPLMWGVSALQVSTPRVARGRPVADAARGRSFYLLDLNSQPLIAIHM